MIIRSRIPWIPCGALAASIGIATACSSSTPPGFVQNDAGSGAGTQNSTVPSTTTQPMSTGSAYTGPSSTGNPANTGTGSTTQTTSTGNSTSTGTSTTGAMYCGTAGSMYSVPCSAPSVGTPIALENCVLPTTIVPNSYVSTYGDGTSTGCVDTNILCASGMTAAQNASFSNYGSAISISLGAGVTPTTGLQYAVSSIPTYGLQIGIKVGTTTYCAEVAATAATSGTIPYSMFNTLCYDSPPDGGVFNPSGATITNVNFQTNSGSAAAAWGFCVSKLAF